MPKVNAKPELIAAPGCIILIPYEESNLISISDSMKSKDNAGVAVSVGPSYRNEHGVEMTTDVKIGDVVVHGNFHPLPQYHHYGKLHRIIRFQEVLGFIK